MANDEVRIVFSKWVEVPKLSVIGEPFQGGGIFLEPCRVGKKNHPTKLRWDTKRNEDMIGDELGDMLCFYFL